MRELKGNEAQKIRRLRFLVARLPCLRPAAEEGYLEQDVPPACVGSSIVPANASPDRAADG